MTTRPFDSLTGPADGASVVIAISEPNAARHRQHAEGRQIDRLDAVIDEDTELHVALDGMKHARRPVDTRGTGDDTITMGATAPRARSMATIAFAGTFGTIIEWYDFLIYGTAAALVFNKLFFPTVDPLTGTLAALATYAVGFVARPVGGALFGYFGDRIGRKSMLLLTMMIMGARHVPGRTAADL